MQTNNVAKETFKSLVDRCGALERDDTNRDVFVYGGKKYLVSQTREGNIRQMYSDVDYVVQRRDHQWVLIEPNNLEIKWSNIRIDGTLDSHRKLWTWGTAQLLIWGRVKPWTWPVTEKLPLWA